MTVRLAGRLICVTAEEDRIVRDHLPAHIDATRQEPGCLSFTVEPDAVPLAWVVQEAFTDRTAFEAHQRRTALSDWGRATAGIQRDYIIRDE